MYRFLQDACLPFGLYYKKENINQFAAKGVCLFKQAPFLCFWRKGRRGKRGLQPKDVGRFLKIMMISGSIAL